MEYDIIGARAISLRHTPTWQDGRLLWARAHSVLTFEINGVEMALEGWGRVAGVLKRYVKPGCQFSCKARLQVHHTVLHNTKTAAKCAGPSGDALNFITYSFEIINKTLKCHKQEEHHA